MMMMIICDTIQNKNALECELYTYRLNVRHFFRRFIDFRFFFIHFFHFICNLFAFQSEIFQHMTEFLFLSSSPLAGIDDSVVAVKMSRKKL